MHRYTKVDPVDFYKRQLLNFQFKNIRDDWYNSGLCPFHNDRNARSFGFHRKTGAFNCFVCGAKGSNIISFIMNLHSIGYVEAMSLLHSKYFYTYESKSYYQDKTSATNVKPSNLDFILNKIIKETVDAPGTIVEDYLTSRGYTGDIPEDIRFHPWLKPHESNIHYPAMVGIVRKEPDDQIIAIHRTFLKNNKKAPIEKPKQFRGSPLGGAVKIGDNKSLIVVAEGIETALSIYLATGLTTWATLSTSGMKNIILPPVDQVSRVIIASDNDEPGLNAANNLASRLIYNRYQVYIATPSEIGQDFNDLLQRGE